MNVQLLDYSTKHLVVIENRLSKIQDGTFKIIHSISLEMYEDILNETITYTNKNIHLLNIPYPYLKHETQEIQNIIGEIRPSSEQRSKRSINIIGTAWK